jgi:hypothetical protein
VCQVRDVAKVKLHNLSDVVADSARWLVVSERVCWEMLGESSLQQACDCELCLAIVGLPRVRNHLSQRMRDTALRHIEMAVALIMLQVAVTSVVESVLGCLSDEAFQVEVVGKLLAKIWRIEELCSLLEWPSTRIHDLLLGRPLGRDR